MDLPGSVLFVCSHNAVRSPMAEALMKHFHGLRVWVQSAGVRPTEPDPFMVAAMAEKGYDLSRHRCRSFEQLEDMSFDVVVSLSPEAHHHALEMTRTSATQVEFWNVFDPTIVEGDREKRMAAYRGLRDTLTGRILARFPLAAEALIRHPGHAPA